jgi:chloramphenicol 3-O phosphotransferase
VISVIELSLPMSKIFFINGTSSAGKSTISKALRLHFPTFCYFASDQLADESFRPLLRNDEERNRFFDGFHRSIASFADAGCDLIVEHIVEEPSWKEEIDRLLQCHKVLWIGVHCPLPVLEQREIERGDRTIGEALYHVKTHGYCNYHLEVNTVSQSTEEIIELIKANYEKYLLG